MAEIERVKTNVFQEGKPVYLNFHTAQGVRDNQRRAVYSTTDPSENYGNWLCDVEEWANSGWRLHKRGGELPEEINRQKFPGYKEAALFYLTFTIAVKRETERHPLPPDVMSVLESISRSLNDEKQDLDKQYMALWRRRQELLWLAKTYNLDRLVYQNEDSENTRAVKDMLEFKLCGQDAPFLSEACLYDLVGKEDARTILALFRGIVEKIDPELTMEF
jgi:hypothetical protein